MLIAWFGVLPMPARVLSLSAHFGGSPVPSPPAMDGSTAAPAAAKPPTADATPPPTNHHRPRPAPAATPPATPAPTATPSPAASASAATAPTATNPSPSPNCSKTTLDNTWKRQGAAHGGACRGRASSPTWLARSGRSRMLRGLAAVLARTGHAGTRGNQPPMVPSRVERVVWGCQQHARGAHRTSVRGDHARSGFSASPWYAAGCLLLTSHTVGHQSCYFQAMR